MIKNKRQLHRAIAGKVESITAEDIFSSPIYAESLMSMTDGLLECKRPIKTIIFSDASQNASIAYTDNNSVSINRSSKYVRACKTIEEADMYIRGLNLHENGHLLFTDFALNNEVMEKLRKREIYPMPRDNRYLVELAEYIDDKTSNIALLASMFHTLDNVIEDGCVDRSNNRFFPGYIENNKKVYDVEIALDEIPYEEVKKKMKSMSERLYYLIFAYAVHGHILHKQEDVEKDEVLKMFEYLKPTITSALFEPNPLKRKRLVYAIFCGFFHMVLEDAKKEEEERKKREQEQQEKNGKSDSSEKTPGSKGKGNGPKGKEEEKNGKSDSSEKTPESKDKENGSGEKKDATDSKGTSENGTGTKQDDSKPSTESINSVIENTEKNMPTTENKDHSGVNTTANSEAIKMLEQMGGPENPSSTKKSSKNQSGGVGPSGELEKLKEKIAQEKIGEEQEKEIAKQLQENAKQYTADASIHRDIHCTVKRAKPDPYAIARYEQRHTQLDMIVRRLCKEFEKEIKERQIGDTLTGLYFGKRLDSAHLYRDDKKIFSNKQLPEDVPDMIVGIMIDGSGSMSGGKIEKAIECGYITYEFCRKLNIPCFVICHTTSGREVVLYSVADEDSIDSKDKMRIFSLDAGGSNRDGYALRYCLKKLEHAPQRDKLMMVISDGRPAHYGYGLIEGRKDCQAAVHDAIKKGITTIAAGLGSDAESIRQVYKEGKSDKDSATFLDISDISKMPKAFVKIIKKHLQ